MSLLPFLVRLLYGLCSRLNYPPAISDAGLASSRSVATVYLLQQCCVHLGKVAMANTPWANHYPVRSLLRRMLCAQASSVIASGYCVHSPQALQQPSLGPRRDAIERILRCSEPNLAQRSLEQFRMYLSSVIIRIRLSTLGIACSRYFSSQKISRDAAT